MRASQLGACLTINLHVANVKNENRNAIESTRRPLDEIPFDIAEDSEAAVGKPAASSYSSSPVP
jgi:hypothetical protein